MQNKNMLIRDRLVIDVSLWSANLAAIGDDIKRLNPYADLFHIDVSDGHFVPGLLFFPDLVSALRPLTDLPMHVHLMTERPEELAVSFMEAGADIITVHVEDKATAVASLDIIRKAGKRGGLAIRLDTPLEELIPYFDEIELVLMMGTQLGVKGQGLAYNACDRIRAMRRMIREHGYAGRIAIFADGGIRLNTVPDLRAAGADGIVPGSLVFGSEDIAETIAWLHGLPQPEEGEDGGAQ